ncbi:VOC family protein [Staphylococcus caprae]|uniref:VOC family protein n=1 Tax=Staphylococcus caprae TaxID=29380 RepID=UPI000E6A6AD4|nr:VOC family protein [Staphylococcus caprae]MBU5272336.1 VOC family protein [Staphylococcus caprae]MDK6298067.1 VOC family protein [Staphylococcus caprae]MDK7231524.1 VOC family protein [Staphylococcus caprae]RIM35767.1 VOC family protein [Staphylococcus caprae]
MELIFDHIIHYIDQLERFQFPGKLLKLHSGGKHHKFGTFNQLSYINGNYIEMLDVEDKEKLKKLAKSEEGRVSFATKIAQDNFMQGFKSISLRTNDIEQVKQTLTDRGVDTIGPLRMERDNKKGDKVGWQLLYIANPDYRVKPPFFIQWDESEASREAHLKDYYQKQFSIEAVVISSSQRHKTVEDWKQWYDMQILHEYDTYTDLILKDDDILFRIEDGKESGYRTLIIKDANATAPYSIFIRGAKYRFEPIN